MNHPTFDDTLDASKLSPMHQTIPVDDGMNSTFTMEIPNTYTNFGGAGPTKATLPMIYTDRSNYFEVSNVPTPHDPDNYIKVPSGGKKAHHSRTKSKK